MSQIFNTIPTYMPSIAWYKAALQASEINYCGTANFNRKWHSNKTNLVGANGAQFLSVPLLGGRNQRIPFNQVAISYETNWQKQHYRSLETMYGKAAFFEYYISELKLLYNTQFTLLQEWNLATIQFLNSCLQIKLNTNLAEQNTNISIPSILETPIFYQQVFAEKHGFLPNASMLDMVFCNGPQSLLLLKK